MSREANQAELHHDEDQAIALCPECGEREFG
jgi:predicted RNA-binding Zn-ribbon protein involved in translation (DUF1610 family)